MKPGPGRAHGLQRIHKRLTTGIIDHRASMFGPFSDDLLVKTIIIIIYVRSYMQNVIVILPFPGSFLCLYNYALKTDISRDSSQSWTIMLSVHSIFYLLGFSIQGLFL